MKIFFLQHFNLYVNVKFHKYKKYYSSKVWGQQEFIFYFFKEISTFIQLWWIKIINSHSKNIYKVTKESSKNPEINTSQCQLSSKGRI